MKICFEGKRGIREIKGVGQWLQEHPLCASSPASPGGKSLPDMGYPVQALCPQNSGAWNTKVTFAACWRVGARPC